jgi:uncharacterized protein
MAERMGPVKRLLIATALLGLLAGNAAAADFDQLGRTFTDELLTRAFDKVIEQFDSRMAAGLPREKLTALADGLNAQAGAFKAVESVNVEDLSTQNLHRVFLILAFEKGRLLETVVFNDDSKVVGLFFTPAPPPASALWIAPPYVDPAAFSEKDVEVGDLRLPGTLALPNGRGPFPAVVLVHGSGPEDRDETVGGVKVFKDLAEGLASNGVAVIRYDKRTLAARGPIATVQDEVIDDVLAAVRRLREEPGVAAARVFVVGHSLGAMLAPRIAAAAATAANGAPLAGIVVMAGPTRPVAEVALEQVRKLLGEHSPQAVATEESLKQIQSPELKPDSTVSFLGGRTPGSYWLDLRAYDPASTAAALKMPILVMQGLRDYQVTSDDFDGWKRALGGKPNATLKPYPSLNHLFVTGNGPSRPEEYLEPGHVDEQVVRDMAAWITSH